MHNMSNIKYGNFVKPSSSVEHTKLRSSGVLSGNYARQLYLEEIQKESDRNKFTNDHNTFQNKCKKRKKYLEVTDNELFLAVQNNNDSTLIEVLDSCPSKINIVDEYGWSLLMIACQANSVEIAKELLHRGINLTVRDRAGNSAQSLVIKNKNLELVNLLLNHKYNKEEIKSQASVQKRKEEYICEICDNKVFPSKDEHLSSTVHNINASKGRKIPANYVIPSTNRGFQIMLKAGWDKDLGLGPDGTGKRYPIKTVQKKDRKGLGNAKRIEELKEDTKKCKHRRTIKKEYHDNRVMEINFRRQFY